MQKIKVRESKADDVFDIAYRLREDDLNDLNYSNSTPVNALSKGYIQGCYTYLVDGKPAGMFGLTEVNNDTAGIWFLGTEESTKYKKDWIKLGRLYIGYFLSIYPTLVNIVSKTNKTHIKWLTHLGAKFYPSDKEGFLVFKIEREG